MDRLFLFSQIKALFLGGLVALCVLGLCMTLVPLQATAKDNNQTDSDWVSLPESGRSSFVGIHGGTAPVSVLSSEADLSAETVSGRTGDDFGQVLNDSTASAALQTEPVNTSAALIPFGLGETQSASAASTRLARADQEKVKPRGAIRLKVDGLKILEADEPPVSPESLLQAEELARI